MSGIIHLRLDEDFSHLPSAGFTGYSLIPGAHAKAGGELKFLADPEDLARGTTVEIRG
jgi:hypothetical protein